MATIKEAKFDRSGDTITITLFCKDTNWAEIIFARLTNELAEYGTVHLDIVLSDEARQA
jgi:hypothetical protein